MYYSTVSEPHTKLVRHLEPFSFFDQEALGTTVEYIHLVLLYDDSFLMNDRRYFFFTWFMNIFGRVEKDLSTRESEDLVFLFYLLLLLLHHYNVVLNKNLLHPHNHSY